MMLREDPTNQHGKMSAKMAGMFGGVKNQIQNERLVKWHAITVLLTAIDGKCICQPPQKAY
jgi:hypothetical protein